MIESARHALQSAVDAVARAFAPPLAIDVAASMTIDNFAGTEYDAEHAMSAIAAYPWARVGADAIATNLSQVPIVATDASGDRVESHWMLDLLRRPDPSMGGRRWRRQIVADFVLSGNIVCVITRDGTGRPVRLRRRHPHGWQVRTNAAGDLVGWVDPGGALYSPSEILHIGDLSWRDDPAIALLGESRIRPLDLGIRAATSARKQAGAAAKRGRLEAIVTTDSVLGPGAARKISDELENVRRGGTGTVVAGGGLKVQPLSLLPRDTEWSQLDERTSVECLAVMGVLPVRAQLPSANYGAAKQEMRQYWENLQALAELIDEELTELCGDGITIAHSFEKVESLQTSRTERLSRVQQWVQLGAEPLAAAKFEGFADAPLLPGMMPAETQTIPPSPSLQVDTPQAQSTEGITRALQGAAEWLDAAGGPDIDADPVAASWALVERLEGTALASHALGIASDLIECVTVARLVDPDVRLCDLPAFGESHAAILAAQTVGDDYVGS